VGESAAGTAAGGTHGFAPALTSFIGRDGPLREVAALLAECRLVTVTGPGGSGKTRLAGEVSRRVAGRFADGVWLAELAAVADPTVVAAVVAAALGVGEQPGGPAVEVVARALAARQLLLVLDNCEHVIGAAAALCAGLLAAADDVRVLATSREPLRVAGEARYRLGPLAVPGADGAVDVAGSEAVALFADRARHADAQFTLDAQTGPAVARLVRRLDGMPLAIELAAARVEALGVTQLLERLDDRFALLADGDRLAAGRHQSLAGAVAWSYQLLDEPERLAFRAVSVFPGPFTLEGAEAVAGPQAGPTVLHLVDCSLLSPPRAGPDGRARYLMLETLRAYGARLLDEAEEQEHAAAALAGYALEVAEQAAAGLQTSAGERDAARWLDAEDATMAQVLAWAMAQDTAVALRLADALGWWWHLRGRLPGAYPLLREITARAQPGSDQWCAVQFWLGWSAAYCADPAALDHFTALRDAVAGQAPSRALADALGGRAMQLRDRGQIGEAAADAGRALAVAREVGYPVGEVIALAELSWEARYAGDFDDAMRLARQAEQILDRIPPALARSCSFVLTGALADVGDLAAAERVSAAGLAQSRDAGDVRNQAVLLPFIADLDLRAGRTGDATGHLQEGLQIAVRTGNWLDGLFPCLYHCGILCAATGRHAEALTVWAADDALGGREGFADTPWAAARWEDQRRAARQALGPALARSAEERGAAMSLATAAEYALLLTAPGPAAVAPGAGQLSARERELVTLVGRGCTDAQIAEQLYISVRTVRSHLDRIRDKTGCRRRTDLTRLALTAGLV
jgi:predicted ATPase/DNA-binding CsgD family transcriptional regulator